MKKVDGLCAMRFALVETDGVWVRTDIDDAPRYQHGKCEFCGRAVGARKGDIRADHWYHLDGEQSCDYWHEPKGPWHKAWQNCFPVSRQEYIITRDWNGALTKHIADIYTKSGFIIECQLSPISRAKIAERESFYGRMIWIVAGRNLTSTNISCQTLNSFRRVVPGTDDKVFVIHEKHTSCFNRHWRDSPKYVFFDPTPDVVEDIDKKELVCLFPNGIVHEHYICCYIRAKELLDAFLGDDIRPFFSMLEDWASKASGFAAEELAREKERLRRAGIRDAPTVSGFDLSGIDLKTSEVSPRLYSSETSDEIWNKNGMTDKWKEYLADKKRRRIRDRYGR